MSHPHRSSRALETELAHPPWAGNPTIGLATPRPFCSPHLPSPATSPARPKIKTPRSASHLPSIVRRGHDSFLFSLSHGIQGKARDPKFSGLFICSHGLFTMTSGQTAPSHAEQSRVVPIMFSCGFIPRWSLVFPGTQDGAAGVLAHVPIGNSH